ncbi:MAG: hypothetical protein B6242_07390 [Anaerolineaceae bacterium 4572_78]|nr:MAG: hypothetical protein B6242_07390 [Anaerolineaceae bacterium 4572_78]
MDKKFNYITLIFFIIILSLPLVVCSGSEPVTEIPQEEPVEESTSIPEEPIVLASPPPIAELPTDSGDLVHIEHVDVQLMESFPVQASVVVHGYLVNCTTIGEIINARTEQTFNILVPIERLADVDCTDEPQAFAEVVILDVVDLPAGDYEVNVNSVNNMFSLSMDNTAEGEASSELGTSQNGSISGIVWDDYCHAVGRSGGAPTGCVPSGQGGYISDGILDANEGRLTNVEILLSPGTCPATGGPASSIIFASTMTDGNGAYTFAELQNGKYCVSINANSEKNTSIRLPGFWTAPSKIGTITIELGAGEVKSNVNFGWFYQQNPSGEVSGCVDQAKFIKDITIPDNTILNPSQRFVKTWQIRNEGTCLWGPGYQLVFVDGVIMGASPTNPLQQVVQPGQTIDLSVSLVAPGNAGTYRGNWKLRNTNSDIFGSRGDNPFYVQIVVQ